jgi:hypothetical protein
MTKDIEMPSNKIDYKYKYMKYKMLYLKLIKQMNMNKDTSYFNNMKGGFNTIHLINKIQVGPDNNIIATHNDSTYKFICYKLSEKLYINNINDFQIFYNSFTNYTLMKNRRCKDIYEIIRNKKIKTRVDCIYEYPGIVINEKEYLFYFENINFLNKKIMFEDQKDFDRFFLNVKKLFNYPPK